MKRKERKERKEPNRKLNVAVARSIPLLLLGIIGYASWVITKVLCVDYLLHPPPSISAPRRTGPAVAILTIYYVLLVLMLICYGRLVDTVARNPGLVPRGRQWYVEKERNKRQRRSHPDRLEAKGDGSSMHEKASDKDTTIGSGKRRGGSSRIGFRVQDFWLKESFACNYDGRPPFCSTCYNWKPDRAHHCSELDRCVLRMDHFCPWVGGVVGETSFKFFIQFTFWAAIFCLHTLVADAYFLAQRRRNDGTINVHCAVVLGLAGMFFLFSFGMCLSTTQFAFINSTTIENLSRKRKVWYMAVHIPDHNLQQLQESGGINELRTITYPRPSHEQIDLLAQSGVQLSTDEAQHAQTPGSDSSVAGAVRTFAILETPAGVCPWDCGYWENFVDIMGYTIWDWLLPVRPSPCVRHDSMDSLYRLGPVMDRIRKENGIVACDEARVTRRKKHRRHRRHREGQPASG